jgi:hypothetical protein
MNKNRKFLEPGAVCKDGAGRSITWNGKGYEGLDPEQGDIKYDGQEIYYAWDVPEGSQNRGKPYIVSSGEGK